MEFFGKTKEGQDVYTVTLKNKNHMEVEILTLGAALHRIILEDADGIRRDVILGYDTPAEYQDSTCYFGMVVGRNANRICEGKLAIDGISYELEQNNGRNNLHSGAHGLSFKVWDVTEETEGAATFRAVSPDMEQGFPGTMTVSVRYTLSDEDTLAIAYEARSDRTTVANFTNHAYFNLDGHDSGSIESQRLAIFAEGYTPIIDSGSIPTGEIASVEDTPFDFRVMKTIGESIHDDFDQLKFAGGFDHNMALAYEGDGTMELAARAQGVISGIQMECRTDCPGVQFYTGNFIDPQKGKDGADYDFRQGFCLETQYFPDSVNQENFVQPILKAGDTYHSRTEYHFEIIRQER